MVRRSIQPGWLGPSPSTRGVAGLHAVRVRRGRSRWTSEVAKPAVEPGRREVVRRAPARRAGGSTDQRARRGARGRRAVRAPAPRVSPAGSGGGAGTGGAGGTAGGMAGASGRGGSNGGAGSAGSGGTATEVLGRWAGGCRGDYVAPTGNDANPHVAQPLRTLAARSRTHTERRDDLGHHGVPARRDVPARARSRSPTRTRQRWLLRQVPGLSGQRPLSPAASRSPGGSCSTRPRTLLTSRVTSASASSTSAGQDIRAQPKPRANNAPNFDRISGVDKARAGRRASVSSWNNLTGRDALHDQLGPRLASTTSGSTAYLNAEDAILFTRPYPQLAYTTTGKQQCLLRERPRAPRPGEVVLTRARTSLLRLAPARHERATVVAPVVETLVSGGRASQQAGYLWFQGLWFASRPISVRACTDSSTDRRASTT